MGGQFVKTRKREIWYANLLLLGLVCASPAQAISVTDRTNGNCVTTVVYDQAKIGTGGPRATGTSISCPVTVNSFGMAGQFNNGAGRVSDATDTIDGTYKCSNGESGTVSSLGSAAPAVSSLTLACQDTTFGSKYGQTWKSTSATNSCAFTITETIGSSKGEAISQWTLSPNSSCGGL